MNESDIVTNTISSTPARETKHVLRIILIVIGSFIVFCASIATIIFLIVNTTTKEPLQASTDFLTSFSTTSADAVYQTTSDQFKATVTRTDFATFFNTYNVLPFSDAKITGKEIESTELGSVATFTYSLTYKNATYKLETQFLKEGNTWKLLSINLDAI